MNRILLAILAALSSLVAMPGAATAASFDCAKAVTPFEGAICADPDLSLADERLATTFATAMGGLSDAALADLRGGQRDWQICAVASGTGSLTHSAPAPARPSR